MLWYVSFFLVLSGADHRELENDVQEFINRSIANVENATTTTTTQEEYELIGHVPKLPPRKEYPRGSSLSAEGWTAFQDYNGRIEDADGTKLFIFRGASVDCKLTNNVHHIFMISSYRVYNQL